MRIGSHYFTACKRTRTDTASYYTIEKLVYRQLVISLQDEKDCRIILLDITDKGMELLETAHQKGFECKRNDAFKNNKRSKKTNATYSQQN